MDAQKSSQTKLTRTQSSLLRSSPTIRSSIHSLTSVAEEDVIKTQQQQQQHQQLGEDLEEQKKVKPHRSGSTPRSTGSTRFTTVLTLVSLIFVTLFSLSFFFFFYLRREEIPTSENLLLALIFIAITLFFASKNKKLINQNLIVFKQLWEESTKRLNFSISRTKSKQVQWFIGDPNASNNSKGKKLDKRIIREGVEFYSNGDSYEGEFHKGKCNGSGVYNFFVNGTYEGDWIDGRYDGYGIESWARGSRYRGQYRQGLRHGYGVYRFYTGDSYAGEWFNGQSHGVGVQTCADASCYVGEFKCAVKHGLGVYHFRLHSRSSILTKNLKPSSSLASVPLCPLVSRLPQSLSPSKGRVFPLGKEMSLTQDEKCKGKGKHFKWTKPMSNMLLELLADEALKGNKPSSTFKAESFVKVATEINAIFNVQCEPKHVENHLRTVKKEWGIITTLRGKSGFGWDDCLKMITVSKDVYAEEVKAHPNHEKYLNRKLDFYDEMTLVVGKDMATGNFAKSFADVNLEENTEVHSISMENEVEYEETSKGKGTSSSATQKRQHRKRSRMHENDDADKFSEQIGDVVSAIKSISKNQLDVSVLYEAVMEVEGFDEITLVCAFDYLVQNEMLAKAFLVKRADLRKFWVQTFVNTHYNRPAS